jgi:UDP-N-acetyl-D-mannosaminuronate dehydrogenase
VLGLTFKENCPAVRNSKVPEVIRQLVQRYENPETVVHQAASGLPV